MVHITHVENLAAIVESGEILCDRRCAALALTSSRELDSGVVLQSYRPV